MIIGLTGTFASGKDTVAEFLIEDGFEHHSLSDELRGVSKERGIEPSRENLQKLGNAVRDEFDDDYLARRAMKKAKGNQLVISSIRQPGEVEYLKTLPDFYMVAVDAPVEERFKRMQKRARPGDPQTLEEMKEKEAREMGSKENNAQQVQKCLEMADYTIINDGTYEDLKRKTDDVIRKIKSKKAR